MRMWLKSRVTLKVVCVAALMSALLGFVLPEAPGQTLMRGGPYSGQGCSPPPCLPPGASPQYITPSPSGTTMPGAGSPGGTGTGGDPAAANAGNAGSQNTTTDTAAGAGFGSEGASAVGGGLVAATPGGYIDNAVPITTFRLRYDAGFNVNRPDRATYFYATWHELSFHPHGVQGKDRIFFDPKARGPDSSPQSIDFQEPSAYAEYAISNRFSVFADVPLRYVHFTGSQEEGADGRFRMRNGGFFPEPNGGRSESDPKNTSGISDLQFGFKAALVAEPDQYLTFQLRTYVPTGDARQGLGTGHVSIEPSLLLYQRLTDISDRLVLLGQLTDWIPVNGGPMQGNVLQYGAGLAYDVYRSGEFRITPVTEFVGWTVLNGYESIFLGSGFASSQLDVPPTHGVRDATGDTIINAKFGIRTYFNNNNSLYLGYGHALTGDRWYKDIFRAEYRLTF